MTLRVAGAIEVKTDGGLMEAKGQWSYNLGHPKREPIFGANLKVIGYKETAQEPPVAPSSPSFQFWYLRAM